MFFFLKKQNNFAPFYIGKGAAKPLFTVYSKKHYFYRKIAITLRPPWV